MRLYLVDSAPPFVWPKVDGFPRSCSGVSPRCGKIAPLVGLVVVVGFSGSVCEYSSACSRI